MGGSNATGPAAGGARRRRTPPRVAALVVSWFAASLASLFLAKHVLDEHPVDEGTFTLFQFAVSLFFGLLATKGVGLWRLESMSWRQTRAILPLSTAFLVKEVLKYVSIARVSINLVNTVRSLGPVVAIALEYSVFKKVPPPSVMLSMLPIVFGIVLTSVAEMHVASSTDGGFITFVLGFSAAVASTAINQSQNVYSKILFGKERIDPISLQIYLSAISLALLTPLFLVRTLYTAVTTWSSPSLAMPTLRLAGLLLLTGFVSFISSQLAFTTLSKISPVSYSVANTFKRVCIAVIAIVFVGEHLSLVNGSGITISILGVFIYERASRKYKASAMYDQLSCTPSQSLDAHETVNISALSLAPNSHARFQDNGPRGHDYKRKQAPADPPYNDSIDTPRVRAITTRSPVLLPSSGNDASRAKQQRNPAAALEPVLHRQSGATILQIPSFPPKIT